MSLIKAKFSICVQTKVQNKNTLYSLRLACKESEKIRARHGYTLDTSLDQPICGMAGSRTVTPVEYNVMESLIPSILRDYPGWNCLNFLRGRLRYVFVGYQANFP